MENIKDKLIIRFLDLDIRYFNLGLPHRDATDDKVTVENAEATLKLFLDVATVCSGIKGKTKTKKKMQEVGNVKSLDSLVS